MPSLVSPARNWQNSSSDIAASSAIVLTALVACILHSPCLLVSDNVLRVSLVIHHHIRWLPIPRCIDRLQSLRLSLGDGLLLHLAGGYKDRFDWHAKPLVLC